MPRIRDKDGTQARIRELHAQGFSVRAIGKKIGRSAGFVHATLKATPAPAATAAPTDNPAPPSPTEAGEAFELAEAAPPKGGPKRAPERPTKPHQPAEANTQEAPDRDLIF